MPIPRGFGNVVNHLIGDLAPAIDNRSDRSFDNEYRRQFQRRTAHREGVTMTRQICPYILPEDGTRTLCASEVNACERLEKAGSDGGVGVFC